MKVVICPAYGGPEVLQLTEIPRPEPQAHEVLIRIHATSVNSGDCRLRRADPFAVRLFFGLLKPKLPVLGVVFSGTIEVIGTAVTRYKVGDQVFGTADMRYGLGTYADYKTLPEDAPMAIKPMCVTHEEAAAIPFGASAALYFLRKANLKHGQRVFINGASGAVGTAMVQLARYYGAHITASCSAANRELVRALGADVVIDYRETPPHTLQQQFDLIIDTVNTLSIGRSMRQLNKGGQLICVYFGLKELLQRSWYMLLFRKNILIGTPNDTSLEMRFLAQLVRIGDLKPVIDRCYPIEEIAAAHAYTDLGHKKGSVVISLK